MRVPLLKATVPNKRDLLQSFSKVFDEGILAEGKYVYDFERKFSNFFGLKNSIAVSSGTSAIHIALILAGIKQGDEVISTSMTAEPTNTAILQSGAVPIFADIDPATGNLDPESIENNLSKKTKCILVVHYAGYTAKMDAILEIAKKYKLFVIEDCAHALGAKIGNKSVGSFGDFAIFSFQAIKHITTIDGGMLILKNKKYAQRAKKIRWFGLLKGKPRDQNRIKELGFKYNMTNISAVMGLEQLKTFKSKLKKYQFNGNYLTNELIESNILIPARIDADSKPSFWFFTCTSSASKKAISKLVNSGIDASKVHLPNHFHPIFKNSIRGELKNTERFYKQLIHLPSGWWVTKKDLDYIIKIIKSI